MVVFFLLLQDDPIDYCTNPKTDKIIRRLSLPVDYEHVDDFQNSKNYRKWQIHGKWIRGLSSGGSRNNIELFATNPQFELVVGKHTGWIYDLALKMVKICTN